MSYFVKSNSQAQDYSIRSERLCIPFAVVHSATPASKTNSNDLPSALVLALQGQTAAAAAIDSGTNFATPTDSTGVFGALLYNLGTIAKVQRVSVDMLSSGTLAVTLAGASSSGVTASGNVALSCDWSGDLTATDLSACLSIDYIISKA